MHLPCHSLSVWCGRCIVLTASLLVAIALTSCRHKEIVCPGGESGIITVRFMWDNAPEAKPDGMTLYFFSMESGGKVWRYDIAGREGGRVELPSGTYRLLAYNNDLPRITYSGTAAYETFTANAAYSAESMVYPPGTLYAGTVEMLTVTPCGVEYVKPDGDIKQCNQNLVRCYPRRLTVNYTIEVRGMKGLAYMRSASARIEGLAPSLRLFDDCPQGEPVGEVATLSPSEAESRLTARLTGFGNAPFTQENILTVNIVSKDGKTYQKTFDVTAQILNSPTPKDVFIVVEGFEIPEVVGPSNPDTDVGIEVGVDGWDIINIDLSSENIPMN